MFLFIDGRTVILSVEQNIDLYYRTYTEEFGAISRTRWEGSKEYEIAYASAQRDTANAVIIDQGLTKALNGIADINEQIKRPAVLHSRVAERFAEEGYIATIRQADDTTKGIVAICVDYERDVVHLDRVLTVGTDAVVSFGYVTTTYGSIDDLVFDGITINTLSITSDYSLPSKLLFSSFAQAPNHPTTIDSYYVGHGLVTYTWVGTAAVDGRYEIADNALADFIVANNTLPVGFYFPADDVTAPDTITQDQFIANLIANEMLPAGQHMIGGVSLPVALSNGQSINVQWAVPVQHTLDWKITLTIDKNSQYAVDDVDTIVARFLENFNALNALGNNITPGAYYQIQRDAPWAAAIDSTYSLDGGGFTGVIYLANYDDKFNATLTPANVTIL